MSQSISPVAIDYTAALEQSGGIGRYVRELVRALATVDKQTAYRLFATGQRSSQLPPLPGHNFSWHTARLHQDWFARIWHRAQVPLPVNLWTGPVGLFHATDFTLPPVSGKTRTLLTVHDLSFIKTPETAAASLKAYLEAVVPRSVQRADHILADSQATKQDLIEVYQTPESKISVLYSGVDAQFHPVTRTETLQLLRDTYNLGAHPYILSIGTVQPRKNYGRLAEAFARLNYPDLLLIIAGGRGWLEDSLYQQIDRLSLGERVRFLGFVPDHDLPALYSAAEVLALPSLYEGFGLPVIEAMACGTPVLTSNLSSLPEVAGNAARLVDPLDVEEISHALESLLNDSHLRTDLVAQGFKQASKFTWQNAAQQLHSQYCDLLS